MRKSLQGYILGVYAVGLKCFLISMILVFEELQDVHHRNYSRKISTQASLQAIARDQLLGDLYRN